MDVGCEYYGYVSDIIRVWLVNGKFSELQREFYELVLRVYKKCLKVRYNIFLKYLFIQGYFKC